MSCHYSCGSCSKPTFFDVCLSCQATRTLTSGVCACSGTLKQILQPTCMQSQDSKQQTAMKAFYYVSIILYFVIMMCFLIRYKLSLTKKIIDTCQVTALIVYMRFNFSTLGKSSLSVIDNFNFAFANPYCNKATPPLFCTGFENFIAPSIVLLIFVFMYFLTYSIIYFKQPDVVKFNTFHKQNFDNYLYLYLNFSLTVNTISLCRLVAYSPWSLLLLFPFSILYIYLCTRFYRLINSPKQTKLLYRSKYCTLYLYDQNYHINYIDYLYQKVPFTVKSNFMLFELTFKMLFTASMIVSYENKPALTGYVLVFLMWVQFFSLRVFCKYENIKLMAYLVLDCVFAGCLSIFWFEFFEQVVFWVVCGLLLALLTAFITEMIINQSEMKVENRIFALSEESEAPNEIQQASAKKEQAKEQDPNPSNLQLFEL